MRHRNEIDIFEKGIIDAVFAAADAIRYLYVLMREEVLNDGEPGKRSAYSIMALSFTDGELLDSEYVFDITSEYETAERIFRAVVDGAASPLLIRDIIEDMIASI